MMNYQKKIFKIQTKVFTIKKSVRWEYFNKIR